MVEQLIPDRCNQTSFQPNRIASDSWVWIPDRCNQFSVERANAGLLESKLSVQVHDDLLKVYNKRVRECSIP
jgi:hypothetical protein